MTSPLDQPSIKLLRVNFLDNANIRRAKCVPSNRFNSIFETGIGLTEASQAFPCMYDFICPDSGLSVCKDVYMIPDPDTVRVVPWNKGQAMAMSDVMTVEEGEVVPWAHCPRDLLKRVVREAKEGLGIDVHVGVENEFILMKEDGVTTSDKTSYAQTTSLEINKVFIDDLLESLDELDIPLWLMHPEGCNGQIEICLHYDDPVRIADNQYYFKEAVTANAIKHGMKAVFLPKVVPDQAGNGMHCHFSINRDGKNLFRNEENPFELTGEAASFVAGILEHLPGIMAISASNVSSYSRLVENYWAGVYSCWGYDNKEVPLRVSRSLTGLNTVEYKTPDQFSNIYLLLASVIACGIDGIKKGLQLPEALDKNPADLDEESRKAQNIHRLPERLEDALDAFENDTFLMSLFGANRAQAYLAVKRYELNFFNKLESVADVVKTMIDKQ